MSDAKLAKLRTLSLFGTVMITVTSIDSIRNLPSTALFGTPLIFFFLAAALLFLIPCALVAAELSAGWPKRGGVYLWVKEAFGMKCGFLAIWFQWVENVIWYPTILSFLAGTAAYLVNPALASDKYYLLSVILIVYWVTTLINLRGLHTSVWLSIVCGIIGLFLPMGLIILLGAIWIFHGNPLQISFSPSHWLPDFTDPSLLVSMTGVLLSYAGMEIAAVHACDMKDPQRDFPRAMLISTVIIGATMALGSLAIAIIIPHDKLNLVSGIMQAFSEFLTAYHLTYCMPVLTVFIISGTIVGISNWTLAPACGLLVAAQDGNLPPWLQRENRFAAPSALLILQAVIVSILVWVFIFMPTINSAYWLLTVVTSQLYTIMYMLMFAAAIRLRYKHATVPRPFKIPGGKIGMWLVAGIGLLTSLFTFCIGFVPPQGIGISNALQFTFMVLGILVVMSVPPFIMYAMRKPHWKDSVHALAHDR